MSQAKVLIIDDDEHLRNILILMLQTAGYACTAAESGEKGMEAMLVEEYDCVVCDYNMPGASGLEVLERIRESHATTPVIMLTGCVEVDLAVKLMRQGAFDFLPKPILREHFVQCLARAVRHKVLLKENRRLALENRTYQRQLEKKVIEQTFQISTQSEFVNRLNSSGDLETAVGLVEHFTRQLLTCDGLSLMIRKEEGFDFFQLYGTDGRGVREFEIAQADELFFKKLAQDRIIQLDREQTNPLSGALGKHSGEQGPWARMVAAALNLDGLPFGVLVLGFADGSKPIQDKEMQILRFVVDSASIAVHNQLNRMKLEKGYLDTVKALALAVEAKDPYTRGHSDRVRIYAEMIGRRLNLPEKEIKMLSFAGILHDIGKIGVPRALLHKATKLTELEFEKVKQHPVTGENLISHIAFLRKARKMIRHHHERWDGKGYPDRARGEEICLGARIMAVADTFDAMTTDRPYRKAFSPEVAIEELVRCSNKQFDRNCVKAFLDLPREQLRTQDPQCHGVETALSA